MVQPRQPLITEAGNSPSPDQAARLVAPSSPATDPPPAAPAPAAGIRVRR